MQFIDTAKEISRIFTKIFKYEVINSLLLDLESEMYQLNHLLTEQRSLLTSLYNTSILGDDSHLVVEPGSNKDDTEEKKEEIRKQKLIALKDKIKGCSVSNYTLFYLIIFKNLKLFVACIRYAAS